MHKNFTKDERVAIDILILYSVVCAIFIIARFNNERLRIQIGIAFLILFIGYMFFNRTVKFIFFILKNRKHLYDSNCTITDKKYTRMGKATITVYISEYKDSKNKKHKEDIFRSFSIKKWEIGTQLKIKINKNDPEQIIIVFSDICEAIFESILGTVFEIILIIVFLHLL